MSNVATNLSHCILIWNLKDNDDFHNNPVIILTEIPPHDISILIDNLYARVSCLKIVDKKF